MWECRRSASSPGRVRDADMVKRASDYISAVTRQRRWVGSVVLVALACAIVAVTSFAAPRRLAVTGFQESTDPPSLIDRDASALTTVGVDGVLLRPDGGAIGQIDQSALSQLQRAHADGLRAELVVSNWNARFNNFAEPTATRLLTNQAFIARVSRQLAAAARSQGWDGICIDIETMTQADGPGLVRLLGRLRSLLGPARTVSVTISNATSAGDFASGGYELAALGRVASRVILMAYDQHGPWEGAPGPIGALGWQRQGLGILLKVVPAAKVDLGVAGYGYWWQRHPA